MQGDHHRRWQAFFADHDAVVAPVATLQPRPWTELAPTEIDGVPTESYYHWLRLAYAATVAGHPAITVPCGLDDDGLPFGLQIVGRRHGDRPDPPAHRSWRATRSRPATLPGAGQGRAVWIRAVAVITKHPDSKGNICASEVHRIQFRSERVDAGPRVMQPPPRSTES